MYSYTEYTKLLFIRAGSTFKSSGGQLLPVDTIIINESWENNNMDNDIALVKLKSPISIHNNYTIKLPNPNQEIQPWSSLSVTGWGATGEHQCPEILQEVVVPVIPHDLCVSTYADESQKITENMFCAGVLKTGGRGSCSYDSGGPATIDGVLIGIVSWGKGCGQPEYPEVYTNVANYVDWIKNTIKGSIK